MMLPDSVILIAEDDENDAALMRRAFGQCCPTYQLRIVHNGEEVIAYLSGEGRYADREKYPIPTVLLLDLKMPKKNGLEVLAWIQKQPTLKRLIVVVLTASDQDADIDRAYDLGANSYLVKPSEYPALVDLAKRVVSYWLSVNREPTVSRQVVSNQELS